MENFLHQIKNIALKSGKSKIAIIGKGDSIKDVDLSKLEDFFIINLNDSEKIIPGNLALFYRVDFYNQIKNNGFKADYYIAPDHLKIPDHKHLEVKYKPLGQDSFDHTFDYLQEERFSLTDFTIISAIKFLILYQEVVGKDLEAYFVGFDFRAEKVTPDDYQMHDLEYKNVFLQTQESVFTTLLKTFGSVYPHIKLIHIGEKSYSTLSISGLNRMLKDLSANHPASTITNNGMYKRLLQECKDTGKVIVVAEFTNNHLGDPARLIKMIELAKESGADIIKLQKRDIDTFYTAKELAKPYQSPFGKTLGDYRRGVELTNDMFLLVDEHCCKNEIPWFTSVLDWKSYEFMMDFDPALLKLPSTISNHKNYLLKVGNHFKGDLVISTGFTNQEYEEFVLENFMIDRNLFLLQCTSSYPTPPEACQIAVVRHYDEIREYLYPNLFSGYSSHDVGSLGCMLAVAAGARMLEKHVKLGNLDWIHFDGVAIDLHGNQFKNFVHDVRKAELMCGTKQKDIHIAEHHKYVPNDFHN
ncbi:N-acetylneuraminate synthase family protein [Dyadobacter diqingensis]|uniref:N-acetylneuraminate synthase family protein n=1 Tax=Dyadobacter diqingensis TaxID=2938121 RepID=UPI0020C19B0E|nr:N-acetylneuraminate synthase family protein [Dyadobacter diqingensis]